MNDFSKWVKRNRLRVGLTQTQLANKVGVTTVQVNKWETGKSLCHFPSLIKLCKLFETKFIINPRSNLG